MATVRYYRMIPSAALSGIMIMAAQDIMAGRLSVGDLVQEGSYFFLVIKKTLNRSWLTVFFSKSPYL